MQRTNLQPHMTRESINEAVWANERLFLDFKNIICKIAFETFLEI